MISAIYEYGGFWFELFDEDVDDDEDDEDDDEDVDDGDSVGE